jgi:hypothetical protein
MQGCARSITHRTATRRFGNGVSCRRRPLRAVLWTLSALLAACGSDSGPMSEDYGNLLASPAGLVVLESEHPTGWGRSDCFGCHNVNNIHQVNRTGLPDDVADLAGVRAIVQAQGEASCPLCHGDNGVPQ